MSKDPGSGFKKSMEPSSLLEAIFIFIGRLLFKAIEYLTAFTHIFPKSSTPSKSLSDMPVDVVSLIVERSDYKEQLILRKVSKSLRALVDEVRPACKTVCVHCSTNFILCVYDNQRVVYRKPDLQHFKFTQNYNLHDKSIVRDDYEKIAFDDLASTLKNPRLQLEGFVPRFFASSDPFSCFGDYSRQYAKLRDVLDSMDNQLSCRLCRIEVNCHSSDYHSILPYLKPGVLETISIDYIIFEEFGRKLPYKTLKKISLLDQWKQAKELKVWSSYEDESMKFATHFKRFHFQERLVTGDLLIRIRNYLSTHHNFEFCLISAMRPFDAQQLRTEVGDPAAPNERTEYVAHYSIPNSDDYLEFLFFEKSIEIRKVKKS
ncbi:unnamed protein product [Caenorhabditis brenneri]